jgi:hypothetical protein
MLSCGEVFTSISQALRWTSTSTSKPKSSKQPGEGFGPVAKQSAIVVRAIVWETLAHIGLSSIPAELR